MEPQIVGSLIGVLGVILAALLGLWGRSKAKRVVTVERQAEGVSKSIQEESLKRYGFRVESVVSKAEITDLQGTVKLTRNFHGVQITRPDVMLAAIPGTVWVDQPEGKIVEFPELFTPIHFPKAVTLEKRCEENRCEFSVTVAGSLTHGDPPLDYGFQTVYSKGVCITKEEMDEAYKNDVFKMEYHSFDVDIPINVLELEVVFPQGYIVETYPGVFFGKDGYIHNLELQRVSSGFTRELKGAHFRIEDPHMGFRYLVYWVALSEKEVDKLRENG